MFTMSGAVSALSFADVHPLYWYRSDDGIMGGRSVTAPRVTERGLLFAGTINTDGGGFCSVRANIPPGTMSATLHTGLKLKYRGDGKTYKITASDRVRGAGGPSSSSPSWQYDLPTVDRRPVLGAIDDGADGDWDETVIPFLRFRPYIVGRQTEELQNQYGGTFDPSSIQQIGIMLSLKLSDGRPNPVETFGIGKFPFSFELASIEPVWMDEKTCLN
jgi:Complex I intermediate-associated protein 30 (CIA30)